MTDSQMANLLDMVRLQTEEIQLLKARYAALLHTLAGAAEMPVDELVGRVESTAKDIFEKSDNRGTKKLMDALAAVSEQLKQQSHTASNLRVN